MSDVLPEIINDPDLIVESDEEDLLAPADEVAVEMEVREIDTDDVFVKKGLKNATDPVVKKVKSDKRRKPMSEEHKQKLFVARQKAVESRRAKAAEKKKIKELESIADVKQKQKKLKELEDIVNDVPEPKPKADIDPSIIEKAIEDALTKQEMIRQKRKAAKKAKLDEDVAKAKAHEVIRQAVYPSKLYAGDQGFASAHIYNFQ
tara:strand:- start:10645 stop:11256 length:612 start_codon:yes stop_codon:yes gene_type:complete